MREDLTIMLLAAIPTNVKKDDIITSVLTSRMEPIIATVWKKKLPPQGPYMVGPPEPYSEASQKQMLFASEQVHTYIVSRQLQYKTKKLYKKPGQDFEKIYKPKK